jgi:hypothetical protein
VTYRHWSNMENYMIVKLNSKEAKIFGVLIFVGIYQPPLWLVAVVLCLIVNS